MSSQPTSEQTSDSIHVCVTGASGFVGSHVVNQLLSNPKKYIVHATVRDASNSKYDWIKEKVAETDEQRERLVFHSADLLKEGSFDDAVSGCKYVLHVASPYSMNVKDPQKDLLAPALKGTLNVLNSCQNASTVQRVVLTSSVAAITDSPENGHIYTEKDWNEKSSLKRLPYYYSKVRAEKAAWKFIEEKKPHFDMVVINPHMVIGKSFSSSLNESPKVLADICNGNFPVLMDVAFTFVDVADVAKSHILAMESTNEDVSNQRYICSEGTSVKFKDIAEQIHHTLPHHFVPTTDMSGSFGSFMMKCLSYTQPSAVGTFMRSHIGRTFAVDNNKIKKDLQMEFTPWRESISETMKDLKKWKHISEDGKKLKS